MLWLPWEVHPTPWWMYDHRNLEGFALAAAQYCRSPGVGSLLPLANFRSRRTTPEQRAEEKLLANNLQSFAGYGSANFVSSFPSLAPCNCTWR